MVFAMLASSNVMAIDPPTIGGNLKDGNTYILFNLLQPNLYWSRTSWDGAYYLLSYDASNYKTSTFVAHKADDGTWYFSVTSTSTTTNEDGETVETEETKYVGIPSGSNNLNATLDEPAYWKAEKSDKDGYYFLTAVSGNGNSKVNGRFLHLNSGGIYVVITEESSNWFPDIYGGLQTDGDYEDAEYLLSSDGNYLPKDSTSLYWAFADTSAIADYKNKAELYSAIKDIEDNYADIEGFESGFQNLIDVATKYYTLEDFRAEDLEEALAIIKAKKNFYSEIETATTLYDNAEDQSTTGAKSLKTAIEEATSIFNSTSTMSDIETATEALKTAETNFSLGTGDLTALGNNMSFENLSNQGGTTTTTVVAPPYGWSMYVNGTNVSTADEIKSAGITGWCGINADATGALDGSYAWGIWNSSMPSLELSQTISDLENGTYIVQAALMVGANGNGSRRTTQRIFGNLNSQYFGAQEDYNASELDQLEVYSFEGLSEPVTDQELQEMTLKAYVYDGTLTFGFRTDGNIAAANRTTSNSAGGDGWFKLDNFRLSYSGYDVNDALDIYNHYKESLTDLNNSQMQKSVSETIISTIESTSVDASSSQDEITTAFLTLKDMYPVAKSSADAYEDLSEALEKHFENVETYGNYGGMDEYFDAVYDAEAAYGDGELDEAGIEKIINDLDSLFAIAKMNAVEYGDITETVIVNGSFEDLSNQGNSSSSGVVAPPAGWDLYIDGKKVTTASEIQAAGVTGWCAINGGDDISSYGATDENGDVISVQYVDGTHLWGIWNGNIPEVELSQSFSGLPAGTYTLGAYVMVEYQWAGNCLTTQRIFANKYVQMFASEDLCSVLPDDALEAQSIDANASDEDLKHLTFAGYSCTSDDVYTHTLRPMSLTFGVDESGTATIGFRTDNKQDGVAMGSGIGWFKVDKFTLSYDSDDIPTGINDVKTSGVSTTINSREYYSVNGARLSAPQHGVNIIKNVMSDGTVKVTKSIVK